MPIFVSFRHFAIVVFALPSAPFGIPSVVFWMYFFAGLVLIIGLGRILSEIQQEHGVAKIMLFGQLFFAIPMAVFGSEHFTLTADLAALVPRWIPAHTFWVYAVGIGFICAGISIAALVEARLAAALVGLTFLTFVLVMDLPGAIANAHNRFGWTLALRELAFACGALAFAMSPWSSRRRLPSPTSSWLAFPRLAIGIACVFYGVEHLLHPANVPGVPLERLTPAWIQGHIFLTYFVGVILIVTGVCLLLNNKARTAATFLGCTILLAVLWIYLPMLLAAPKDLETLNYFFDTLLFCGAILLLANALETESAGQQIIARQSAYAP